MPESIFRKLHQTKSSLPVVSGLLCEVALIFSFVCRSYNQA